MNHAVEGRVLRTVGLLFGVAGAVYGLLDLGSLLDQIGETPAAWTVAAVIATVGLPIVLGVASPFVGVRTIRALASLVAIGNLLALATVPLVFTGSAAADESPWVLQLTGLGTTGAALGLPIGLVVADVLLTGALVGFDRSWTSTDALALIPSQDGAYAALFSAIFAALVIGAVRVGRSVDVASDAAIDATESARDERVRADERTRINGLVHDHVLTTLLVAARGAPPDASLSADAQDALERLERLTQPGGSEQAVGATELLDRLRAQLTTIAPDAAFVVEGDHPGPIPARPAEALIGAVGEALRNSRRHAGPTADIEVHVTLDDDCVEISVIDDGAGFLRSEVPVNRLGIVTSIEGRMRNVGGTATVRSQRGRGTAVQLVWHAR